MRKGRGGGREFVSECKFSLGQDALFLIDLGFQKRFLDRIILKYGIWGHDLLLVQFFFPIKLFQGCSIPFRWHSGAMTYFRN